MAKTRTKGSLALEKLREVLAAIQRLPSGVNSLEGVIREMQSIRTVLLKSEGSIYVLGSRDIPTTDGWDHFLNHFAEALVDLGEITSNESKLALAEVDRIRRASRKIVDLACLRDEADKLGYDLVKKETKRTK